MFYGNTVETICWGVAQVVVRKFRELEVAGSSPVTPTRIANKRDWN